MSDEQNSSTDAGDAGPADSYSAIEKAVSRFDDAAAAVDSASLSQKATPIVEEMRDAGRELVDAVHAFLDDLADASELATVDPAAGTVTEPSSGDAPAPDARGQAPADTGQPDAGDVAGAVADNQPAGDHPDTFAL